MRLTGRDHVAARRRSLRAGGRRSGCGSAASRRSRCGLPARRLSTRRGRREDAVDRVVGRRRRDLAGDLGIGRCTRGRSTRHCGGGLDRHLDRTTRTECGDQAGDEQRERPNGEAVRAITEFVLGQLLGRRHPHAAGDVAASGEGCDQRHRGIQTRDHRQRLGRGAGIGMRRGGAEADAGAKRQQYHAYGAGDEGTQDHGAPLHRANDVATVAAAGVGETTAVVGHGTLPSAQSEEGQDEQHDHDEPYEIDQAAHWESP